jgi:hypothetical protein
MIGLYLAAIYLGLAGLAGSAGMAGGPGQVASLLLGASGRSLRLVLLVMTAAGLAVVLPLIAADRRGGRRAAGRDSSPRGAHAARRLALTASAAALVIAGIVFKNFGARAGTSDADWSALTSPAASVGQETASSAAPEGRILAPWIDGFMTWALTGMEPACHVEQIDREATLIYWCHDAEAAAACKERGISHIFWSSRYYRASLSSDSAGQPIVSHLTPERALFYQDSGWPERNRASGGDPNMVYTLISLMGQPRAELAVALPSVDLVAEAPARGSPQEPGARVFRLRESARSSYELPIPDLPSPAVAAMNRP